MNEVHKIIFKVFAPIIMVIILVVFVASFNQEQKRIDWIDGDTFDHSGERYRLRTCDTPEIFSRSKCPAEREKGFEATRFVSTITDSPELYVWKIEPVLKKGKYGRNIADLMIAGAHSIPDGPYNPWRSICDFLILENLAVKQWEEKDWCVENE